MPVRVIDPPQPIVTIDEAKEFARIDGDDQDLMVAALVLSAQGEIDGPNGWLGRAFCEQRLEASFCRFDQIRLPCPAIIEVETVEYLDAAGVVHSVDATWYTVTGRDLRLNTGFSWPSTAFRDDAVRVTYLAGEEADSADLERAKVAVMTSVTLQFDGEHEQADKILRLMVSHMQVYA